MRFRRKSTNNSHLAINKLLLYLGTDIIIIHLLSGGSFRWLLYRLTYNLLYLLLLLWILLFLVKLRSLIIRVLLQACKQILEWSLSAWVRWLKSNLIWVDIYSHWHVKSCLPYITDLDAILWLLVLIL